MAKPGANYLLGKKQKKKKKALSNPFVWGVGRRLAPIIFMEWALIRLGAHADHLLMGFLNILKLFV